MVLPGITHVDAKRTRPPKADGRLAQEDRFPDGTDAARSKRTAGVGEGRGARPCVQHRLRRPGHLARADGESAGRRAAICGRSAPRAHPRRSGSPRQLRRVRRRQGRHDALPTARQRSDAVQRRRARGSVCALRRDHRPAHRAAAHPGGGPQERRRPRRRGGRPHCPALQPHLGDARRHGRLLVRPDGPRHAPRLRGEAAFIPADAGQRSDQHLPQLPRGPRRVDHRPRLDRPAVAVDGVPIPPEDAFAMLLNDNGRFNLEKPFQFDVPERTFTKPRTFLITEVDLGPAPVAPVVPASSAFPPVDPDGKGNVIPLILTDPFAVNSSGPNTTGDIVRIDQAELDAARINNTPSLLPAAIEANFMRLIEAGLLSPDWGPCGRSYQDRLAVVGRALFELVWKPEQGANQKDVTRCLACHTQPAPGAAGRGLYTRELPGGIKINPGSLWGSGGAEELVKEKKARGENVTFAHGSLGHLVSIRTTLNNVSNTFFGIQSAEFVRSQASALAHCDTDGNGAVSLAEAMVCDLDGDGVVNELSVGEVTTETAFFMTLPAPDQAPDDILPLIGVTHESVESGKRLFRRSIDDGGAACASCHTPFHPLEHTEFVLSNPQTNVGLPLRVSHHVSDADDVAEGLASFVGQPGLRTWGDFKLHKMGARLFSNNTDRAKTAEVWDAGSVFPYARDGSFGSDLRAVIRAHGGVSLDSVTVDVGPQVDAPAGASTVSSQTVTLTNTSGDTIAASPSAPIRVVLTGALT